MSRAKEQSNRQTAQTTFKCNAEGASTVFVAGSFNGWSESATPMTRGKNGIWSAGVGLAPGTYEYKFIIDGQWCCSPELLPDPSRAMCVRNGHGTMNFAADAGAIEK